MIPADVSGCCSCPAPGTVFLFVSWDDGMSDREADAALGRHPHPETRVSCEDHFIDVLNEFVEGCDDDAEGVRVVELIGSDED